MGIQVEFNPDLALRDISHHREGKRSLEECLPKLLREGATHHFKKKGQRNYYFLEPVPLLETKGNQRLSRPLAAVTILEATHFLKEGIMYTKGRYRIEKVFDPASLEVYFEGMNINPQYKERKD
ncbi:MAG: hypothetical protein AABX04_03760 [Nanoarchaeota archaeon]